MRLFFIGRNRLQRGDQVVTVLPDVLKRRHDCFDFGIRRGLVGLDRNAQIAVLQTGVSHPALELIVRAVRRDTQILERRVLFVFAQSQKRFHLTDGHAERVGQPELILFLGCELYSVFLAYLDRKSVV